MGNFYTNITLYRVNRADVLARVKGRKAAISPIVRDFTLVWDEETESQNIQILEAIAKRFSLELNCPALAVLNHDDDVLVYMLFLAGTKLDEYNSCPGYFDGSRSEPTGGDATLLAKTFGVESVAKTVHAVLRETNGYAFAIERHQALIDALEMPSLGVGTGYRYITRGECPPGLESIDDIVFSE